MITMFVSRLSSSTVLSFQVTVTSVPLTPVVGEIEKYEFESPLYPLTDQDVLPLSSTVNLSVFPSLVSNNASLEMFTRLGDALCTICNLYSLFFSSIIVIVPFL